MLTCRRLWVFFLVRIQTVSIFFISTLVIDHLLPSNCAHQLSCGQVVVTWESYPAWVHSLAFHLWVILLLTWILNTWAAPTHFYPSTVLRFWLNPLHTATLCLNPTDGPSNPLHCLWDPSFNRWHNRLVSRGLNGPLTLLWGTNRKHRESLNKTRAPLPPTPQLWKCWLYQ